MYACMYTNMMVCCRLLRCYCSNMGPQVSERVFVCMCICIYVFVSDSMRTCVVRSWRCAASCRSQSAAPIQTLSDFTDSVSSVIVTASEIMTRCAHGLSCCMYACMHVRALAAALMAVFACLIFVRARCAMTCYHVSLQC